MALMSLCGPFGLGGTIAALKAGAERIFSRSISGVGATAASAKPGARKEDFKPSVGAGPGTGL